MRLPAALRHRNFRVFYGGQFVSLIGTWMQIAAQNWLVYTLTGSAEKLGEVTLVQAVPGMLITALGGVIADRYSKRNILYVTQTSSMVLAFILFWLVYRGEVTYEQIVFLALALGVVNAVDMPTRGAFVADLVDRGDLHSAIALNSTIFNASRILGPAVAGFTVMHVGTATCFLINGLSFLGPLICLAFLRLPAMQQTASTPSMLGQLTEGVTYIRGHRHIRRIILLMAGTSIVAWGTGVLLPVFAKDILHGGARSYGLLMSSGGVGAVIGAFLLSMSHGAEDAVLRRRVVGGLLVFAVVNVGFAWSRNEPLSMLIQVVSGWASITYFSTSNTWLQTLVSDDMRGRVIGLYHTMFMGIMPLGSFLSGWTAERIGAPLALTIAMGACLLLTLAFAARETDVRAPGSPLCEDAPEDSTASRGSASGGRA